VWRNGLCERKILDRWKISRKWKLDAASGLKKGEAQSEVKLINSSPREKKLKKKMNGLSRKIQWSSRGKKDKEYSRLINTLWVIVPGLRDWIGTGK
jgi:hypothetical protein